MTSPYSASTAAIGLMIGGVMTGLGVWIAVRLLVMRTTPLTGTFALDLAFAVFFVARGLIQYRRWRLARDKVNRA